MTKYLAESSVDVIFLGFYLMFILFFSFLQQWSTMSRIWWLYDAKYQCPFRSSRVIAGYLQGQHKPIYHALCKDFKS